MNKNKKFTMKGGGGKSIRFSTFSALLAVSATALAVLGPFNPPGNHPADPNDATSILAFTQRDFVSASGYLQDDRVVVRVIHDSTVFPGASGGTSGENAADWISPQGDPADGPGQFSGIVEVNHPGGACWKDQTPDIRPGDKVEIEIKGNVSDITRIGRKDYTIVQNITAKRPIQTAPGTVVVHGTAQDSFTAIPGNQLPIGILVHRLVAPGQIFPVSNKRTLRATSAAGADGTLAYDAPGSINWTATYSGLSEEDVSIALGAESRILWLGNATAPSVETTIYEIGALTAAGPGAPCTAPLESLPPPPGSELVPPSTPTNLHATISNSNTVTLNWTASTDNVGVTAYGVYRNGQAIFTVSNPDGSDPAPTTFVDPNTPPGTYTYQVRAFDEVGNASGFSNTSEEVTAVPQVDVNNFPVNDPPGSPGNDISIIAFPSRDFISPSGYLPDDKVTVQVLRRNPAGQNVIVSSAAGIIPDDQGFAEVNHPGGACWAGVTPEIRAGDTIRTIAYNPSKEGPGNPSGIRTIDQTFIAGVTTFTPVVVTPATAAGNEGVVEIHGTALGPDGNPLPIGQIEQRMIAKKDSFDINGRRAMRAGGGGDGTIAYDTVNNPMGINWTARYTGLDANDVARMAGGTSLSTGKVFEGADTRIHWLGHDPAKLNEATIFENAPGANPPGPAGPACTRPLETADETKPSTPGNFSVVLSSNNSAKLKWDLSSDDWYVAGYRIFDNNRAIANVGPTDSQFTLVNLTPGNHTIAVRAFDTASPLVGGGSIIARISAGLGNPYGNLSDAATTGAGGQNVPDITGPSQPTNLSGTAGNGKVTLTWTASIDDIGVVKYRVRSSFNNNSSTQIDTLDASATFTDGSDTNPLAVGSYKYTVQALDAAGNASTQSDPVTVDVTESPDVLAPTVPGTPTTAVTNPDPISGKDITINWDPSTDVVGVTGYSIYRNGSATPLATVNGATTTYTDANLVAGTYTYTVDAFDSASNRSVKSAASDPLTGVIANDVPPATKSLIAFPARDFISATGYPTAEGPYTFQLIRAGRVFNSVPWPSDADGLVEVNHPGGACWNPNTPDMRPGDVIRIINAAGVADQTRVANVTADRPIQTGPSSVTIKGRALGANNQRIPIGQLEHRLVSRFSFSPSAANNVANKKVLRAASAGAEGVLTYDTNNSSNPNFTVTYTGLTANDMLLMFGGIDTAGTFVPAGGTIAAAESRGVWLGTDPVAGTQLTIHENGPAVAGGPFDPATCGALEGNVPSASINGGLANRNFTTTVNPIVQSGAQTITLSNGGTAALTINNIYFAGVNPGEFVRTGGTCQVNSPVAANGGNCTVLVAYQPTSNAVGTKQANLSFTTNAANTTDLTVPLIGTATDVSNPRVTISTNPAGAINPVPFGTVNGGASSTRNIVVTNTGTGIALNITNVGFAGANPTDFTVSANSCNAPVAANGGTCSVTVAFNPGARTARTANLVLTHNATFTNSATTTTVPLSGTGGTGAVLSFASNPVNFGAVNQGTKDQTISVKNSGNQIATLNLASFTVTGTGFSKVSTTCGNLAVNGSCNVVVRYAAPATIGAFVGSLSVNTANGIPLTATTSLSASRTR